MESINKSLTNILTYLDSMALETNKLLDKIRDRRQCVPVEKPVTVLNMEQVRELTALVAHNPRRDREEMIEEYCSQLN